MLCRIVAALLVVGWISLSGFDVIEDLDEVPGQAALSTSSAGFTAKRGNRGPLANNMVESAYGPQHVVAVFDDFTQTIVLAHPMPVFRKRFSLHKLHRVFLI